MTDTITALIPKCDRCDQELILDEENTVSYELYLPGSNASLQFCRAACLRAHVEESTYLEEVREHATTQSEAATITVTKGL